MRKVVRRWAENGEDVWGIVEAGRFYPMSTWKKIAERILANAVNQSPHHLQEIGCTEDTAYYVLDAPPQKHHEPEKPKAQEPARPKSVTRTGRMFRDDE